MRNITNSIPKYDKLKVNNYLNKISKNTNLNHEFLLETFPGLAYIFNWIKAIFKIYLYKLQNSLSFSSSEKKLEESDRVNDLFPPYTAIDLTKLDAFKKPVKIKKNTMTTLESNYAKRSNVITLKSNNEQFTIKSEEFKRTYEQDINQNLYLTAQFSRNPQVSSLKILNESRNKQNNTEKYFKTNRTDKSTSQVSEKIMKIDVDVNLNKKTMMLKNFKNLPLIHVRTFRQLREHFNPKFENKKRNSSSPVDLETFSLKNPKNCEKMLVVLQKGNIGNLNRATVLEFCKNLEKLNDKLPTNNKLKKH
jgi:hypothetical protein